MNPYQGKLLLIRRKLLNAQECFEFSRTTEGIRSLSNPHNVKKSSKDPNRGLYPRTRLRHRRRNSNTYGGMSHMNSKYEHESDDEISPSPPSSSASPSASFSRSRTLSPGTSPGPWMKAERKGNSHNSASCFSWQHARKALEFSKSSNFDVDHPNESFQNRQTSFAHHQQKLTCSSDDPSSPDFRPWLHEQRKRKFSETGLGKIPNSLPSSPKKRTPKKQTPQKNTLLNYFSSPSKSPSTAKANAGSSEELVGIPYAKEIEQIDLTDSSTSFTALEDGKLDSLSGSVKDSIKVKKDDPDSDSTYVSDSEFSTKVKQDDLDSDSTYVSESELQAMQLQQIQETETDGIVEKELNDIYGLLGSGVSWDWNIEDEQSEPCHFDRLPQDVLENIFCQLPLQGLCLTLSLVSKQWNELISEERFLYWKKKYYQLKYQISAAGVSIESLCVKHGMNSIEHCLLNLLRFVKTFKTLNFSEVDNMLSCLQWHSKYSWAVELLKERIPECFNDSEIPNPWSLIVALCILAHSVRDVSCILDCLTHSRSTCLLVNIIEFMYCLATFFMHFRNSFSISSRYHYIIYYALYLYENKSLVKAKDLTAIRNNASGQQTVRRYVDDNLKIRLTHEQIRIVNHALKPGDVVKIVAFAGTGKTTTLVEFAKMWPSKRFLNAVYNKSVNVYSQRIFPSNVKCQTVHSIAHREVGKYFQSRIVYQLKALDFMDLLEGSNRLMRASMALKTVNNFVSSADEIITITHVPGSRKTRYGEEHLADEKKLQICDDAVRIWNQMKDVGKKVNITHDVYLKLFQLDRIAIDGYDCILLDEAQDYTQAMLSMFMNQSCAKIVVGDPHQQIYSFRGAINSMDSINASHTYYLTQSFRFGSEIAYVASCALETMMKQTRKTIVGTNKLSSFNGDSKGQVAIIARTNFALFAEAVRVCCHENQPIHGAFVGGIQQYSLDQLTDIYNLMVTSNTGIPRGSVQIKNKFIARFKSYDALVSYANNSDDVELQGKLRIVTCYRHSLPAHIKKIKQKCRYNLALADVVFTTAHKSKG